MAKRWIFTYRFSDNLAKIKAFYQGLLKLDLIWEEENMIAFKIGDHQLSFERVENVKPENELFSRQPGWEGGSEARTSWSLECDAEDFREIVTSVREPGMRSYYSEPKWVGYWSFPLLTRQTAQLSSLVMQSNGNKSVCFFAKPHTVFISALQSLYSPRCV